MVVDNIVSRNGPPSPACLRQEETIQNNHFKVKLLGALIVVSTSTMTAGFLSLILLDSSKILASTLIGGLLGLTVMALCWISGSE